jgi:hypothetical protein
MLERADTALYSAKANGRNQIELAPTPPDLVAALAAPAHPRNAFRTAIAHWNPALIWGANGTFTRI